ncbi:cell division protein ZapA [Novosphingobium sp.]|uniref:cell division protein ZapA n=1 Tax=Novosphingobium sp. TaxID=1874826 RepID=UPI0025DC4A3C|nr:cell division protein ZapA [Novosphingobium sp.]
MSNVTLQIGGRAYTMACADGEEAHIAALGRSIADKVEQMGAGQSEVRQLLFASLLLADELHEARGRPSAIAASTPAAYSDENAGAFEAIADRLEKLALSLEG